MTKPSEFSWAKVLAATKPSVAAPTQPESMMAEPVAAETIALAPSTLAEARAAESQALPPSNPIAAAFATATAESKEAAIESPSELPPSKAPAKRLHPARPYVTRQASDKKRWRWARERVIQALYQQILNRTPVDLLDAQFMEDVFMLKVDLALFRRILRGVSANEQALDAAFTPLLDRPLAELDPIEHAILRMGAFELIHTPEIPRAVAINEAVEMAKLYGASESHKYINGVLDKLADRVRTAEPRRPA